MLKEIVTIAYGLTQSSEYNTAMNSFQAAGQNTAEINNLMLKLGQYYRAAKQLVLAARRRQYRIFQSVRVRAFQIDLPRDIKIHAKPGSSIPLIKDLSRRSGMFSLLERFQNSEVQADRALVQRLNNTRCGIKVHAEIKLLFFYELHPYIRRPRVIAANKSSCYLCDLFFKLHGVFQVPSTFGMLNERWVLPDWCKVAPDCLEDLKNILIRFDRALDSQLALVLGHRQRQPVPLESLVAFSACWPDSQEKISPGLVTTTNPSSIRSYTSSALPSVADKKLTAGKYIWWRSRGYESSLIVNFYESYVVLSSNQETIEESCITPSWTRVSLTSLRDDLRRKSSLKNIIKLREIEEGAECTIGRELRQSEICFHIVWNDLAVAILNYATRSRKKRISRSSVTV